MKPDDVGAAQGFPSTRWTVVHEAGRGNKDALEEVLRAYLPALQAHLVFRKRLDRHLAEDALQQFTCDKVLEYGLLKRADRERGKFRTFLLTALDRFMIDLSRRRGHRGSEGSLEDDDNGRSAADRPAPGEADAFNQTWAKLVVEQAIEAMRQQCSSHPDRERVFLLFEERELKPVFFGEPAPAYAELVERFQFASPSQASNALITAKRMFERCLRDVLGKYIQVRADRWPGEQPLSADELRERLIDEELDDLMKAFLPSRA